MQISAIYSTATDKYVASIRNGDKEVFLTTKNGADLVAAVKKETGINIEYNNLTRSFDVPSQYRYY